jgi:hypothetical protein
MHRFITASTAGIKAAGLLSDAVWPADQNGAKRP